MRVGPASINMSFAYRSPMFIGRPMHFACEAVLRADIGGADGLFWREKRNIVYRDTGEHYSVGTEPTFLF